MTRPNADLKLRIIEINRKRVVWIMRQSNTAHVKSDLVRFSEQGDDLIERMDAESVKRTIFVTRVS